MKDKNFDAIKNVLYILAIVVSFVAGYFTNITYAKVKIGEIERRTQKLEAIVDTKIDELKEEIGELRVEVAKLRVLIERNLDPDEARR